MVPKRRCFLGPLFLQRIHVCDGQNSGMLFSLLRDRRAAAGGGEGRDGVLGSGQLVPAGGSGGQSRRVLRARLRPLGANRRGRSPVRQAAQHGRSEAGHAVHGAAGFQERKRHQ